MPAVTESKKAAGDLFGNMKDRILVKIIYFLLRYVKSEIASLALFEEMCKKEADGEYCSVQVEITNYHTGNREVEFTSYIDGKKHCKGFTPTQSIEKLKNLNTHPQVSVVIN